MITDLFIDAGYLYRKFKEAQIAYGVLNVNTLISKIKKMISLDDKDQMRLFFYDAVFPNHLKSRIMANSRQGYKLWRVREAVLSYFQRKQKEQEKEKDLKGEDEIIVRTGVMNFSGSVLDKELLREWAETQKNKPDFATRLVNIMTTGIWPQDVCRDVYKQKQVDTLITLDLERMRINKDVNRGILITNDTDFLPVLEAIKSAKKNKELCLIAFKEKSVTHQLLQTVGSAHVYLANLRDKEYVIDRQSVMRASPQNVAKQKAFAPDKQNPEKKTYRLVTTNEKFGVCKRKQEPVRVSPRKITTKKGNVGFAKSFQEQRIR